MDGPVREQAVHSPERRRCRIPRPGPGGFWF